MIKKTIKYVDYDGNEREEDFYFNLTKAELMQMQLSKDGTMTEYLQRVISARDVPELASVFKKIILAAYGEKSLDGKYFRKVVDGHKLAEDFEQTEAFNNFYMELATDDKAAIDFINALMPTAEKSDREFAKNVAK